jgi:hypothetical protein
MKEGRIDIRATEEKKADYMERAAAMGMKLSEWIRYRLEDHSCIFDKPSTERAGGARVNKPSFGYEEEIIYR